MNMVSSSHDHVCAPSPRQTDPSRPRRIDDDTIAYVRQLEIPLQTMEAEDDLEVLVTNAHREIAKHQASLSVHAKCSVVIEVLLRRSTAAQLLEFAKSVKGYVQFLFSSYYGSHVMQTLVALLGAQASTVDVLKSFCGACVRACVCACMCVRACVCVRVCVCRHAGYCAFRTSDCGVNFIVPGCVSPPNRGTAWQLGTPQL
jgi:hypothetical protein